MLAQAQLPMAAWPVGPFQESGLLILSFGSTEESPPWSNVKHCLCLQDYLEACGAPDRAEFFTYIGQVLRP